jgi:hypothetical protein
VWALNPEVRYGLIQDAIEDLKLSRNRRVRLEFGGSFTAYKNHCAQKRGFKNTYEARVANWEKKGFARPQDYYDDWAQRKGFLDFWHYRKNLKEKNAQKAHAGLIALVEETKSILEAGNPGQIKETLEMKA